MKEQLIGTQAPINRNSPHSMEHDGSTRSGTEQMIGTEAPTRDTPYSLYPINETKEGARQMIGTQAPCNYTPVKGWQSANTPMSDRAVKQSK